MKSSYLTSKYLVLILILGLILVSFLVVTINVTGKGSSVSISTLTPPPENITLAPLGPTKTQDPKYPTITPINLTPIRTSVVYDSSVYPLPLPTMDPNAPYNVVGKGLVPNLPPDMFARDADVIIIGRVIAFGSPSWTTIDGKRPKNPFDYQNSIYTPVIMKVEQILKGDVITDTITRKVSGGKIGNDSSAFEPSEMVAFHLDGRDIIFLRKDDKFNFLERYTIYDDKVTKYRETTMEVAEFLKIIQEVVANR